MCLFVRVCVWGVGQVRSIGCMVRCQQSIANCIKREMFQRKQNQAIQLIGVHPLGAQMESFDPCSQQTISDANAAMMSSSGGCSRGDIWGD